MTPLTCTMYLINANKRDFPKSIEIFHQKSFRADEKNADFLFSNFTVDLSFNNVFLMTVQTSS